MLPRFYHHERARSTAFEPPGRFEFTATGGPVTTPDTDPHRHEFLLSPEDGGTHLELRRTDPCPPDWPTWKVVTVGSLAIRFTLGARVKTVESLKARLDGLADSGPTLTSAA